MFSRAAARDAAAVQQSLTRAVVETLESRRLLSVTNLIEGANSDDANQNGSADPTGAVGPGHVVNAVSSGEALVADEPTSRIQYFTKAGAKQYDEPLQTFFGLSATAQLVDPKIVYDQYSNRFVVTAVEVKVQGLRGSNTNESYYHVAVSDDADPNGNWYRQSVNTKQTIGGVDTWADQPGLGVSQDAIYLTGNMFSFQSAGSQGNEPGAAPAPVIADPESSGFAGTRLWILPKETLYSGGNSFVRVTDPVRAVGLPETTFSLQPAHMFGEVPAGVGTFLVADGGTESNGNERIIVIRVDNPLANPTFTTQVIDVGNVSEGVVEAAPQPWSPQLSGLFTRLDVNDARVQNAVWRNGNLYAVQHVIPPVGSPDAGQVTAHWYQIRTTNLLDLALYDQGDVGGEDIGVGVHTYFPAVAVNGRGDMAIGFSASGPSFYANTTTPVPTPIYAGAYVTSRLGTDLQGTGVRQSIPLAAGEDTFVGVEADEGETQWGDYSAVAVDPSDDRSFWAYNMYALVGTSQLPGFGSDRWGTRWGKFQAELSDLPAVGDYVWHDENGNGIQEEDEEGIAGVVFRLFDANNNLLDEVTSDVNGWWMLQGPPAGGALPGTGYYIEMDIAVATGTDPTAQRPLLEGLTFSPPFQGSPDKDSDFTPTTPVSFRAYYRNLRLDADSFIDDVDAGLFRPFVSVQPPTVAVPEGNLTGAGLPEISNANFRVVLTRPTAGGDVPVTSPWTTNLFYSTFPVSATSDVDYASRTRELLTIPAGASEATIQVPVFGDLQVEGDELFQVRIEQPSTVYEIDPEDYPLGTPLPSGLLSDNSQIDPERPESDRANAIIDDDDETAVSIDSGPTVTEGAGIPTYALFTVRLSAPSPTNGLKVRYSTANGTATAGQDYEATSGELTFNQGQLTQTIRVRVFGDFVVEGDETFSVVLSDPVGPLPGTPMIATAIIEDLGSTSDTFGGKKATQFRDQAGNLVTVTLRGPGSGSLTRAGGGIGRQIVLDGTTEQSVLTIRTNRGQTSFAGIQINGGLGTLNGQTTNLVGSLVATSAIKTLNLNYIAGGQVLLGPSSSPTTQVVVNVKRIADSNLTSDTAVRRLNVGSWVDGGTEDVFSAPLIGQIRATGDFMGSISTGDLGTMSVTRSLSGSTVSATNTIGSVAARSIVNSLISAGVSIGSVAVRGGTFSDSRINAPMIGSLDLGNIQNTTGTTLRMATADRISSARWRFGGKPFRVSGLDLPGDRDLGGNSVLHLT